MSNKTKMDFNFYKPNSEIVTYNSQQHSISLGKAGCLEVLFEGTKVKVRCDVFTNGIEEWNEGYVYKFWLFDWFNLILYRLSSTCDIISIEVNVPMRIRKPIASILNPLLIRTSIKESEVNAFDIGAYLPMLIQVCFD